MTGIDSEYWLIALCGEEGTCKTTMSLTFPKPLSHLDIDVGGYRRAAWRLDTSDIETHSFPKPLTDADIAKMKGITNPNPKASTRTLGVPKRVEGMVELWQSTIDQIVKDALNPKLRSIVIDSATMHYKVGCDAYLQELQEKQLLKYKKEHPNIPFDPNDFREKLQPIEYGFVYDRLQRIYHTCRSYKKNLILIHYPTDEYGPMPDGRGNIVNDKTGKIIMDGYKDTAKFADAVMWLSVRSRMVLSDPSNPKSTKVEEKYPVAKFTKCGIVGMGMKAVGMEVAATYEGIVNLKNLMLGGE